MPTEAGPASEVRKSESVSDENSPNGERAPTFGGQHSQAVPHEAWQPLAVPAGQLQVGDGKLGASQRWKRKQRTSSSETPNVRGSWSSSSGNLITFSMAAFAL